MSSSEKKKEKKDKRRITVNLEEIDYQIIDTLEGVIANSKSSVIYQMIKEWINQNSDRIMNTWDIVMFLFCLLMIEELNYETIKIGLYSSLR